MSLVNVLRVWQPCKLLLNSVLSVLIPKQKYFHQNIIRWAKLISLTCLTKSRILYIENNNTAEGQGHPVSHRIEGRVGTPSRHLPGTFWNFTWDISGFTRDISRRREKFLNLPLFSHGKFSRIIFHTSKSKKSCTCLLYTSPSPRDLSTSRMPSSA